MDTQAAIDPAWFESLRTKRPDFLRRLFEVFMREEPRRLDALADALAAADMEQVRYLSHSLKGAAATMGATGVKDYCLQVEMAAKAGDLPAAKALLPDLRLEMDRVYAFMADFVAKAGPQA